jgi:hypothetical protein
MVVSGVRSSCEASAMNWRIRSSECRARLSDAACAVNAASIWPSIAFSDRDRWPTSVRGSWYPGSYSGTRRARSPWAIAAAVSSISRSGRRLARTIAAPTTASRISTPAPTSSSASTSREIALSTSDRSSASMR